MLAIMVILVLLVAAFDWLVFTNMDIMARYLNKARLAVTESVFGILLAALAVELVLPFMPAGAWITKAMKGACFFRAPKARRWEENYEG
jgi:hypothetical protein